MPPKQRNREKKREDLARQYGFVQAFFDADPELKKLFNQAVRNTWTPERFTAELRDSKWFKKNAVSVRNALVQKTADPGTYKSRITQLVSTIRDTWGSTFGSLPPEGEVRRWAETAYVMGWSEAQVMDHMTKGMNFQKALKSKRLGGTAAETKTQLESLGRAYGLNLGNQYIANQVQKIVRGDDTLEGVATRIKDWAKREYSAFAAEIDGGATIQDIATPYINTMADLLELNPETLHPRMNMIQRALKTTDQDGRPRAMSLSEFEQELRRDHRWQYTNNAREQAMGVTQNLLKSFGLVA